MTTFFYTIRRFVSSHRIISVALLVVVLGTGYAIVKKSHQSSSTPRYVLATATKGTIVQSVSATGQMSTSASVDLKPQTSGTILTVRAKAGDPVTKGETLIVIDPTDAQKALRTAENNLAQAKLDFAATQNQNATDQVDLQKAVTNSYTTLLSSSLTAVPSDFTTTGFSAPTVSGNYTLGKEGRLTVTTYNSQGGTSFEAKGMGLDVYGLASSINPQPIIGTGLFLTFPSNAKSGLTWTIDIPNKNSATYIANKNTYDTAVENLNESQLQASNSNVTLQSKQLAVAAAQTALADAQEALSNCYIKSPFDGILASVSAVAGDSASTATALGTVITNQKIASVTLNEVDVAKVAVGDKATLTFDALPDITLTGTVESIDTVGTVSQGVVNYTVDITLDTDNTAVRSGMSVTASIITASRADVVMVPSSAIKSGTNGSYVLVVDDPIPTPATTGGVVLETPPREVVVTVGISDATNTEIVSGITTGTHVVARTITSTATSAGSRAPTIFNAAGAGGGARRFGG